MKNSLLFIFMCSILLFYSKTTFAQQGFVVKGTVTSADDNSLIPGVSVYVKDKNQNTITDAKGNYQINVKQGGILIFSSLGYETKAVIINSAQTLNVTLSLAVTSLDQIVVIGYGTTTKRDLTGSVSSIKAEEITQTSPINLESALQGRAAGVQVTSSEGGPDAGLKVKIRGSSSLNASNAPLYVIDGFPVDGGNVSNSVGLGNSSASPLSGINPSDIESIEVLKDASATAIYGSRGSNGVVIVTTKSGKKGAPKLTFETNYGLSKVSKFLDVLQGQDFVDYYNQLARPADQGGLAYRDSVAPFAPISASLLPQRNWQKEVYRTTYVTDNKLNISGGTEYTKYFAGLGVTKNSGIVTGSDYSRISLNAKIDQNIGKKFRSGINLTSAYIRRNGIVSSTDNSKAFSGIISNIILFRPVDPARPYEGADLADDGTLISERGNELANPIQIANLQKQYQTGIQTFANTFAEYEIIRDLKVQVKFGGTLDLNKGSAYYPAEFGWGQFKGGGLAIINHRQNIGWLNENTINYQKTIAKNHRINLLAGYTRQRSNVQFFQLQGEGFQIPGINIDNISSATRQDPRLNASDNTTWSLESVLGRFNYSYKGRYLFTATIRTDGSSRFAPGKQWGTFPSAAIAWNIDDEAFMKNNLSFVSTLKLRSSYGLTGNQGIPLFQSQSTLGPVSYQYGNAILIGLASQRLANQNLTWEKTKQLDVGLELGLFQNKVNFTGGYFNKNTYDMLLAKPISLVSGFTSAFYNIGSIRNSGIELSLNTNNVKTKNFSWASNFNITFGKNEVANLGLPGTDKFFVSGLPYDGSYSGYLNDYIVQEGKPIGSMYGWVHQGVYQYSDFTNFDGLNTADAAVKFNQMVAAGTPFTLKSGVAPYTGNSPRPGYMRLADISGPNGVPDGIVNENDRTIIGNPNPKHFGGFANNFSYKNFKLDILLTWSYGNDIYNKNLIDGGSADIYFRNQLGFLRDRWTPEMPSNTYSINGRGNAAAERTSSFFIEDGSFLRLQNITLSYNLDKQFVQKLKMSNVRLFITGNNLHVWNNYSGYDPEVSVGGNGLTPGIDYASYPRSRDFRFGLSTTF